ncbi:hypothetical protein HMPREF3150_02119 [Pseudomonas aeruginosa]|nr:hypothetical protein HMPREF3150_02119 [Pseudomonas aeruginosa]
MSQIHHECELKRRIVEQLEAAGWLVSGNPGLKNTRTSEPAGRKTIRFILLPTA